jgi:hypothetical protein
MCSILIYCGCCCIHNELVVVCLYHRYNVREQKWSGVGYDGKRKVAFYDQSLNFCQSVDIKKIGLFLSKKRSLNSAPVYIMKVFFEIRTQTFQILKLFYKFIFKRHMTKLIIKHHHKNNAHIMTLPTNSKIIPYIAIQKLRRLHFTLISNETGKTQRPYEARASEREEGIKIIV